MKLALGQINTTIADFEGTVRKVADYVARAKAAGAGLIAFPELTTTCYTPRDLVEAPGFVKNLKALEEIATLAKEIGIVVSIGNSIPLRRGGRVVGQGWGLPGIFLPGGAV